VVNPIYFNRLYYTVLGIEILTLIILHINFHSDWLIFVGMQKFTANITPKEKSPELEPDIPALQESSDESVGHYLQCYLLILRCFGTHPFSHDNRTLNASIRYFWKWNSFPSFYSVVVISVVCYFLVTWYIAYFDLVLFNENQIWWVHIWNPYHVILNFKWFL